MRQLFAGFGTVFFLLLAPGTVAGVIPWWITRWQAVTPWPGEPWLRALGVLWILAAVPVFLESFARFALKGIGTPAPVYPTQHLVVTGFYRHMRNPMYAAVVSLVWGQALAFSSAGLLLYGAVLCAVFHIFILTYEEPTLQRTFGSEYQTYRANVPRWLPRLRPWRQDVGG
jgi:protein-S-isoprenylcysteine O-methyltransferase Ste14